MTPETERLLRDLVTALETAFISTWQSTEAWQDELDAAREHIEKIDSAKEQLWLSKLQQ